MQWEAPEPAGRLLFSPSGHLMATTQGYGEEEGENALRLWDALRGQELARLERVGSVVALAFASERQLAIVAWGRPPRDGPSDQCMLWDADSGAVRPLGDDVGTLTATPDGGTLILVMGAEIEARDLPSRAVRHRMRAPWKTGINYHDLAADGPLLVASCREDRDEYAIGALWDTQRGKRLHTYDLAEGQIFTDAVAVSAASGRLAFAFHQKIRSFGMEHEGELDGFKPYRYKDLFALRYSSDGGALEAITERGLVRLNAGTGEVLASMKLPTRLKWERAAFDPAGTKVALAEGQKVEVLDLPD